MARKKRRTYSLEYKLETVALVLERGLSPRQVAKDLGIDLARRKPGSSPHLAAAPRQSSS